MLARIRRVLTAYENAALMIQTGLYVAGSDPAIDEAIRLWPKLDAFFTENAPDGVAASFARLATVLRPEAAARGFEIPKARPPKGKCQPGGAGRGRTRR